MGLLSSLFSNNEIMKDAAKGAINGVDMVFFTDEEKSIRDQKVLDWTLEYQKATFPQNKSRRLMAMGILLVWMFLVITATGLGIYGLKDQSEFVLNILEKLVLQPFNIILGFYFLSQIAGKFGSK